VKVLHHTVIDGYKIAAFISPRSLDPKKTKEAVQTKASDPEIRTKLLGGELSLDDLFRENRVYLLPPPNVELIDNDFAEEMSEKMTYCAENKNRKVTTSGVFIDDFRGDYWVKNGENWETKRIDALGTALPEGYVLEENLTEEQRKEIDAEKEAERIASLTPEQRTGEKQGNLDAAADEAYRLEQRAKIQGTGFDAAAWYQKRRAEIEAKYP
jgi:hypothetical protein